MTPGVRLRDGIEVEFASGETFVLDGPSQGQPPVLSHAHGDHLAGTGESIVASDLTAALAAARRNVATPATVDHPDITLHDAGHVAGSRAVELTDPVTGRTYLYTGDYSTRDRFYLDGFEPVDADVLITETTYGRPEYRFPPTDHVVSAAREWLAETMDSVAVLFGYTLGRAQKLLRILRDSARDRVFVTEAIDDLNGVIESDLDVDFDARPYEPGGEVDLEPGDALVASRRSGRLSWVQDVIDEQDAVTAGFSGWAADRSFVYRRGLDEGFVLSDHCDFAELVDVVRAVDPERVYTHHGYAEDFAAHLTGEYGYETRALKRNQATLADF